MQLEQVASCRPHAVAGSAVLYIPSPALPVPCLALSRSFKDVEKSTSDETIYASALVSPIWSAQLKSSEFYLWASPNHRVRGSAYICKMSRRGRGLEERERKKEREIYARYILADIAQLRPTALSDLDRQHVGLVTLSHSQGEKVGGSPSSSLPSRYAGHGQSIKKKGAV